MKSFILLENIEIYAHHGVFEQETLVGNTFLINIKMAVNFSKASQNDQLSDTVSYAEVYGLIEREMKISSKLLENVAYRIIQQLKDNYSMIENIELKLSKRNPPVRGQVEQASVILIWEKEKEK